MILYCDTSALVKRYVEEEGTTKMDALWDNATDVATSTVAFSEGIAAFSRKRREGILSKKGYSHLIIQFREEHLALILIQVTPHLNALVQALVEKYPLRGFDAIHLASALIIREAYQANFLFACFDKLLNNAAKEEGLIIAC